MTRGAKVKVKVRDNVCNLSLYLFHFNTLLFTEENTLLSGPGTKENVYFLVTRILYNCSKIKGKCKHCLCDTSDNTDIIRLVKSGFSI